MGDGTGLTVCAVDGLVAERHTARMIVAAEIAVELRRFIGMVKVMGESREAVDNIQGNFDGTKVLFGQKSQSDDRTAVLRRDLSFALAVSACFMDLRLNLRALR